MFSQVKLEVSNNKKQNFLFEMFLCKSWPNKNDYKKLIYFTSYFFIYKQHLSFFFLNLLLYTNPFCLCMYVYRMSSYKVERVIGTPINVLGEGPHWDTESQSLYYVDIFGKDAAILRYDFVEKKTYTAKIGL